MAGTSAGAITATVLAFNLESYGSIKSISDSLDYRKVPAEGNLKIENQELIKVNPRALASLSRGIFKNLQCSVRLVQEKGWYSSEYLYSWIRSVIAGQFTTEKELYVQGLQG